MLYKKLIIIFLFFQIFINQGVAKTGSGWFGSISSKFQGFANQILPAEDPDWLVSITTKSRGETLTGTGYIVQVGDDYYIRTASHVTLGSVAGEFISGTSEKLNVIPGKSVTDNAHDDQLISINKPEKSSSIAFYSPTLKQFVVWPKKSRELKKNVRRKNVETGLDPGFYIVPKRLKSSSKDRKFKIRKKSFNTDYSPTYNFSNSLRRVKGEVSLTADMKVVPGESGSPLFKDMQVGYDIKDMNGKHYEYHLPNRSGGATILLGHVQSYQRYVNRSNFSSSIQSQNIIKSLNDSSHLDSGVKWARYKGIFYRYKQTAKGLIQELNSTVDRSGSGTGGNGGNCETGASGSGTGANGGNCESGASGSGTGGNGGNCESGASGSGTGGNGGCSKKDEPVTGAIKMGMIYNGKSITAFKVVEVNLKGIESKYTLYADWENYQFLQDKVKNAKERVSFKAIAFDGAHLAKLIKDKAKRSINYSSAGQGYMRTSRCVIDGDSLVYNHLNVNIQPFEVISIVLNPSFFPIVDVRNKDDGEIYKLDLRGLFSVDAFEFAISFGANEFNHFKETPYVMLRADGYKFARNTCKLERGLNPGLRGRLFPGGKLKIDKSIVKP